MSVGEFYFDRLTGNVSLEDRSPQAAQKKRGGQGAQPKQLMFAKTEAHGPALSSGCEEAWRGQGSSLKLAQPVAAHLTLSVGRSH